MEHAVVQHVVALLLLAFAVALVVRWLFVPYTVALVLAGVGLGAAGLLEDLAVSSDVILLVFLPALLFQAAINLDVGELRAALWPIVVLAVVGVALSIGLIAGPFAALAGISPLVAVVLAGMLSATDPVAVLSVFRRLGVPRRLEMIVEGESLFNDGTALVAFQIAVAAVAMPRLQPLEGLWQFGLIVSGGLLVGLLSGLAVSHLLRLTNDHLVEMGLSTVLAYGTYLVAEGLGVSAVIAVVTAGLVLGSYGRRVGFSPRAREVVVDVWEYLAFVANSIIFLLIGTQVRYIDLQRHLVPVVVAIGLVLLSRAVVIYGLAPLASLFGQRMPLAWRHVAFWGGLRGALAVAMVLSLPATFPEREMLLSVTVSVVVFTILVQGTSIDGLVRMVGLRHR